MIKIPQAQAFEVVDQSDARNVARWERHNAAALIEVKCGLPAASTFQAREVNLELDRVRVALVRATAHSVERDRATVKLRPADSIAVYAGLKGHAEFEHAGRRNGVRPGQIVVCDVDQPFRRGFGRGLEELAVRVPRSALGELTGHDTVAAPLILDSSRNSHARALVRLLQRAVAAAVPVPADELTVLELVAVLAMGGRPDLRIAHRAAARAFIDDHLTDASLSARDVADGVGLSERHVSRLFNEVGSSVPSQVLARRLDLAHSLLMRGKHARTIDAAQACGFTSMAHFSQSFKRRFGVSAGEIRQLGAA